MAKKVKLGLRGLSIQTKINLAKNCVSQMSKNINFPSPEPALTEIEESALKLENSYSDLQNEKKIIKKINCQIDNYERELDKKLTLLGAYVENRAKGSVDIIQSAGMDVRAESQPIGLPERVKILSAKDTGVVCEIKLRWCRVKGAKVYNVEIRDNIRNKSQWKLYDSTTKTKMLIKNLSRGTKYRFRVQAIGSAGKGAYSSPAEKYAS